MENMVFVKKIKITSDMLNNTEPMNMNELLMKRLEEQIKYEMNKPDAITELIATGKLTMREAKLIRELQEENKALKDEVNSLEWEIAEIRMGEDF